MGVSRSKRAEAKPSATPHRSAKGAQPKRSKRARRTLGESGLPRGEVGGPASRPRTWGGARPGAGRPPSGARAGVSHLRRPELSERHPCHVTLRVGEGLASLRGPAVFRAVRAALAAGKERFGFRLVHFSAQRAQLHLLVEAEDQGALERGMQGLSIRVAKAINRELGRAGRLFADRYELCALKTPDAVRSALRDVLLSARKSERGLRGAPAGFIDPCSSAAWLAEAAWERPAQLVLERAKCRAAWETASGSAEPPVAAPRSWLLRSGYLRAGPIDRDEAPEN